MKKMIKIAFVAVFAAIAGYGVFVNQKADVMSDLMLANVEALARYELPEVGVTCDSNPGRCWARYGSLCMKSEYTGPACVRTSNTSNYCDVCY